MLPFDQADTKLSDNNKLLLCLPQKQNTVPVAQNATHVRIKTTVPILVSTSTQLEYPTVIPYNAGFPAVLWKFNQSVHSDTPTGLDNETDYTFVVAGMTYTINGSQAQTVSQVLDAVYSSGLQGLQWDNTNLQRREINDTDVTILQYHGYQQYDTVLTPVDPGTFWSSMTIFDSVETVNLDWTNSILIALKQDAGELATSIQPLTFEVNDTQTLYIYCLDKQGYVNISFYSAPTP